MEYLKQREKIIQAYYNNELNPYVCNACFVGNLLNNKSDWSYCRYMNNSGYGKLLINGDFSNLYENAEKVIKKESNGFYSPEDIFEIESNFLKTIYKNTSIVYLASPEEFKNHPNFEEALFLAMDSTLDLLMEIHKKNGDKSVLELEKPVFTKRTLEKV